MRHLMTSLCATIFGLLGSTYSIAESNTTQSTSAAWQRPPLWAHVATNRIAIPNPPKKQTTREKFQQAGSSPIDPTPQSLRFIADLPVPPQQQTSTISDRQNTYKIEQILLAAAEQHAAKQTFMAINILEEGLPQTRQEFLKNKLRLKIADYYYQLTRYDRAEQYIRKAMTSRPFDPTMLCNLAAVLMSAGKIDEALFELKKIEPQLITNQSLLFSTHFNYACALALKGQVDGSVQHLYKAAKADPEATLLHLTDTQLDSIRQDLRITELQLDLSERTSEIFYSPIEPPPLKSYY